MNPKFVNAMSVLLLVSCLYLVFQNHRILQGTENLQLMMNREDPGALPEDSSAATLPCPCDSTGRYPAEGRQNSQNFPIPDAATCRSMVNNAFPVRSGEKSITITDKGAWFSKKTLDAMFCSMQGSNGIFVYKGMTPEGTPTFIVEAGITNLIETESSNATMYYSRAMCPTECGACGM